MQYTTFGKTGITVSRLCLGCMTYGGGTLPAWAQGTKGWHVSKEDAREHFALALEAGINFFDTADVYSAGLSEEITGALAQEKWPPATISWSPPRSGDRWGTSPNKRGLSRKHIIEGCDNSLRRLQMDYVDLYQIHRWDPVTPIEETLEALDSLVRAGKVRYLGASSMAAWQLSKALYLAKEHGWHRFSSMQNHYNLVYREEEREMIPLCMDQGLAVIPWSPSGARISDRESQARWRGDNSAPRWIVSLKTCTTAKTISWSPIRWPRWQERGVSSAAQVACAWVLQAPGVTAPIIGATKIASFEGSDRFGGIEAERRRSGGDGKALPSASDSGSHPAVAEADVRAE